MNAIARFILALILAAGPFSTPVKAADMPPEVDAAFRLMNSARQDVMRQMVVSIIGSINLSLPAKLSPWLKEGGQKGTNALKTLGYLSYVMEVRAKAAGWAELSACFAEEKAIYEKMVNTGKSFPLPGCRAEIIKAEIARNPIEMSMSYQKASKTIADHYVTVTMRMSESGQ